MKTTVRNLPQNFEPWVCGDVFFAFRKDNTKVTVIWSALVGRFINLESGYSYYVNDLTLTDGPFKIDELYLSRK